MDLSFLRAIRETTPTSAIPTKMIVGLGNPGPEYARSRHNVGFQMIDLFAARHRLIFDKAQKRARVTQGPVTLTGWRGRVLLAKPITYMNASGEAVGPLAKFYKVAPADILVVFDDLDLPVGRLRLRPDGGSSGQKGVKSIIQALGTEAFSRSACRHRPAARPNGSCRLRFAALLRRPGRRDGVCAHEGRGRHRGLAGAWDRCGDEPVQLTTDDGSPTTEA